MISRGSKIETHTSKAERALLNADSDFMTIAMICAVTGSNANQASAALYHLRKVGVVDVVIEADGRGWWFATRGADIRSATVEFRRSEDRPRRRRRGAKVIRLRPEVGDATK